MAFTLAILLVVMLISALLMKSVNIDQPAASGHSLNAGILVAIGRADPAGNSVLSAASSNSPAA